MEKYTIFDKKPIHVIITESYSVEIYQKVLDKIKNNLRSDLEYIIVETDCDYFALAIPLELELNLKVMENIIAHIKM